MSIRGCSILVLVLIGLRALALGQTPPTQNTGDGSDATRSVPAGALSSGIIGLDTESEGETSDELPHIPAMLGGRGTSLVFLSEMERSNYLRGGVNIGAGYDDNALLTSSGQVGNTTFSVFPNIAIEQSTSRTRWDLGYAAGLTVNQRLSNQNQVSQNLRFDSEFRLSPHVNLRAAEYFSMTTGTFGAGAGSGFQPGPGGSNGTLITPLANSRSSQTVLETNYHFALKDLVGASGSFSNLHYGDVSTGAGSLGDTSTAGGSAFWLHNVLGGDWAGISYGFQRIVFDPNGETRVHSFAVMNTLTISKTFTLSAFIGPEYSDNSGVAATGPNAGQVLNFSDWAVAGGLEGGWHNERTSVTAGYSKRTSDGGGVLGAVRLQNVHAAFRRELFPGWATTFAGSYGGNRAATLISSTSATTINATSVGVSLERSIAKSLGFQISYFRYFQNQSGSSDLSQNFDTNRNRFSVTLSYQWAKPLGM
jgi:hypothetical protein